MSISEIQAEIFDDKFGKQMLEANASDRRYRQALDIFAS
jgi:hypothetical protein